MREIVLDTETTGLDPATGDRIVEIGAVELENLLPTGKHYHQYINPERDMPAEAFAVHGLSEAFLAPQPKFAAIGREFLAFIGEAQLVIHNAAFDIRFLNFELKRCGLPEIPESRVVDTLAIARRRFPGARVSLDALCSRFGIDSSSRTLHGALLDSEILAEVYLELRGGRQTGLDLAATPAAGRAAPRTGLAPSRRSPRPVPLGSRLTESEAEAHKKLIESLGPNGLWARFTT